MDNLSTAVKLLIFILVALILGFVVLQFTGTVPLFSSGSAETSAVTEVESESAQ